MQVAGIDCSPALLAMLDLRERTAAESQEVLDAAHAADVDAAQADQAAAAALTAEEEARQVRLKIIRNARTTNVGQSQSCMFDK